jgi:hypothetical protein
MAEYAINGAGIDSLADFWREYLNVVQPGGAACFGRSLSAFNDALWGGPGWPGDEFVLIVENSSSAIANIGMAFFEQLNQICDESKRAKLILR